MRVDVARADGVLLADEGMRRDRAEVPDDWCLVLQLVPTFPARGRRTASASKFLALTVGSACGLT